MGGGGEHCAPPRFCQCNEVNFGQNLGRIGAKIRAKTITAIMFTLNFIDGCFMGGGASNLLKCPF